MMAEGRARAYAVHVYTAAGLIFAMLAAIEICVPDPDPRRVFVWLMITVIIDATDGPLARKFNVKTVVPEIDGRKIDDIVDFLTFTFLPLLLIARMGWVPQPVLLFITPALIASVLGFANVGAKDEAGGFFLGFPSYWNIVAFYAGIGAQWYGRVPNGIALLVLAVLTIAPIAFIYPNLAPRRWKGLILGGAVVWTILMVAMLPRFPNPPLWLVIASLVYPVFYVLVSFRAAKTARNLGGGSNL